MMFRRIVCPQALLIRLHVASTTAVDFAWVVRIVKLDSGCTRGHSIFLIFRKQAGSNEKDYD